MSQFENVTVVKKANVYFDDRSVSHTLLFPDGSRKTVGVLFPGTLTFNTKAPKVMEIVGGTCRVRISGQDEWKTYGGGQRFSVPADSSFEIEALATLDYVCHFG